MEKPHIEILSIRDAFEEGKTGDIPEPETFAEISGAEDLAEFLSNYESSTIVAKMTKEKEPTLGEWSAWRASVSEIASFRRNAVSRYSSRSGRYKASAAESARRLEASGEYLKDFGNIESS